MTSMNNLRPPALHAKKSYNDVAFAFWFHLQTNCIQFWGLHDTFKFKDKHFNDTFYVYQ